MLKKFRRSATLMDGHFEERLPYYHSIDGLRLRNLSYISECSSMLSRNWGIFFFFSSSLLSDLVWLP